MHMADALVSPVVAGVMYACSAVAVGFSIRKIRVSDTNRRIPLMGVMGAFVFAAQMINFAIPGTGSSGHLCGGMLLSALLGPYAGFLTMTAILLIQCLLFADGGLMALGCNVWNMGFYGCFVGGFLIWRALTARKMTRGRILAASVVGCIVSLLLGAFSVTLETLASGITELPFGVFVRFMLPIHLVIGLVEGLITAAVLIFVFESRPELLEGGTARSGSEERLKTPTVVAILAAAALVIGGLLSHLASSDPDGLEWSVEKVTGQTEVEGGGALAAWAADVQGRTALLPDYAFKDSERGTSVSGIVGALVVLALCVVIGLLFRRSGAKPDKIDTDGAA